MAAPRILFYAINGTGLGHLSRLLAIARQAKRLLDCQGRSCDFHVMTTSEASEVAWDFPVYKLPSKTVAVNDAVSARRHAARCKMLISNLVAGIKPDVLVMDTQPEGAFHEFVFLRDYAKAALFIDRRKRREVAEGKVHQSHLGLYERILVPDHPDSAAHYPIASEIATRRRFIGPVHGIREEDWLSPEQVRRTFGARPEQRLVYVSAGGGGDREAETNIHQLVDEVVADPRNLCVVGYGPLYRGKRRYGANVIALGEAEAWRYFRGFDCAFSAGGYNSYQELLAAGIPTSFFAQRKGLDRQDERLAEGRHRGWHRVLAGFDPILIREELTALLDPERADRLRARMAERPRAMGALRGAVALLELQAHVAPSSLDAAALYPAAEAMDLWRRGEVRPITDPSVPFETVWQWHGWRKKTLANRMDLVDEAAAARDRWNRSQLGAEVRPESVCDLDWASWIASRLERWGTDRVTARQLFGRLFKGFDAGAVDQVVRGHFDHLEDHLEPDLLARAIRALHRIERPRETAESLTRLVDAALEGRVPALNLDDPTTWTTDHEEISIVDF
ncbi:hypothetical protein SCOR_00575 [Sulfidibacter corallicola]|uniref:Glycosyl transferase family 28 C-terminal domain-containing protein n=1 Tax=Sulfidibacter corallicola TaxID=2818388 RepID=A0A8A4TFY2_SULCO|nr:hypothetical protein [Sulfidibacter corallicola]QTD48979.1 hypothetical protein J3U87_25625 [Sulfidibacter corallicola]